MNAIQNFFKVTLPNYLSHLPLPTTIQEISELSKEDWLYLGPFLGTIFILILSHLYHLFSSSDSSSSMPSRVNQSIDLDKPKVVNTTTMVELEDIWKTKYKCVYCRCWKSKKFPYCDGTHQKHNKETGDNVGPLIIQK